MSGWKRPDSVPHPRVWRHAVGRKPVDGNVPSFVIQDVPKEREEDFLDFMEQHFAKNEPLCKCLDLSEDVVGTKELRELWIELLAQRIAVVAFLENDGPRPRIAGLNLIGVVTRADKKDKREVGSFLHNCIKTRYRLLS
ncbi:hypothetical protein PR048_006457 [Dryococelus australis]|uniref:Uncharacterized protein n=1 Tax=Dryococelus australis TaxID=614101 RepID=A0ABQ9IC16_9NEOP|nr:hypothetical protein PR048_006457 [Dryococelus australis]